MKILLSGGGTLGPAIPLLAIKESLSEKQPETQYFWVGTKTGPEKKIIEEQGIPFKIIPSGKLRRYWSFLNIVDIFKIIAGFFKAAFILLRTKPELVISAGGYVSVPLHWAAWLLGIPSWVHQQDVEIGFANKLMFPFATIITTAFEDTARLLKKYNARWIGNPCRSLAVSESEIPNWYNFFGVPAGSPTVLVLGGGTGSLSLNNIVIAALPEIPNNWYVIHLLGVNKSIEESEKAKKIYKNYHTFGILGKEMLGAFAISNIVVARAGMGTLTELASLKKPAVIFPKTETHQESNARILGEGGGILVLNEDTDNGVKLGGLIKQLINQKPDADAMGERLSQLLPRATPETLVSIAQGLWSKS